MLSSHVKRELSQILGATNVTFAKEELVCYSYDATNVLYMPEAVAFPKSANEVSLVLKMANAEGFCVVPRGAGTGFTGGSLPVSGGLVLSTERMRSIIEIDEPNLMAIVEPGVVTWELQEAVEARGLFYPPDPTSLKFSTIGGNIAECAGGPRAVKYGVTKDYVMGLEVVLPTGEIINTGTRTVKGVVGYDLTRLMVGSEGTLGVVTKAVLRLIPKPETTRTMLAAFGSIKDAASSVSALIGEKVVPSTLEIMDRASIRSVEEHAKVFLGGAEAVLLIEADGFKESVECESTAIKRVCLSFGATIFREATDKKEVKDLWKARRSISASLHKIRPNKINEDVVVPRACVSALLEGLEGVAKRRSVLIASFGHAGDGNVHVNVMYDKSDPVEEKNAHTAVKDVFDLTLSLGGTLSGEHGVGITKSAYMEMELKAESIALLRRIKKAFDPNGVLNPGKALPIGKGDVNIKDVS